MPRTSGRIRLPVPQNYLYEALLKCDMSPQTVVFIRFAFRREHTTDPPFRALIGRVKMSVWSQHCHNNFFNDALFTIKLESMINKQYQYVEYQLSTFKYHTLYRTVILRYAIDANRRTPTMCLVLSISLDIG